MNPNKILNNLMTAFVFTFVKHWQTPSYARHMALGKFYETLQEQMDSLAEKLMSENREIIEMPKAIIMPVFEDEMDYMKYLDDYLTAQIALLSNNVTIQDELISIHQTVKQALNDFTRN